MTDMLRELAEVVRCSQAHDSDAIATYRSFIRTHHAEIAQNAEAAKRLRALEMAMEDVLIGGAHLMVQERADEIMRSDAGKD